MELSQTQQLIIIGGLNYKFIPQKYKMWMVKQIDRTK